MHMRLLEGLLFIRPGIFCIRFGSFPVCIVLFGRFFRLCVRRQYNRVTNRLNLPFGISDYSCSFICIIREKNIFFIKSLFDYTV